MTSFTVSPIVLSGASGAPLTIPGAPTAECLAKDRPLPLGSSTSTASTQAPLRSVVSGPGACAVGAACCPVLRGSGIVNDFFITCKPLDKNVFALCPQSFSMCFKNSSKNSLLRRNVGRRLTEETVANICITVSSLLHILQHALRRRGITYSPVPRNPRTSPGRCQDRG